VEHGYGRFLQGNRSRLPCNSFGRRFAYPTISGSSRFLKATIRVYSWICRFYFPLIESNQFARKNFFSVGKNVFEGAMIGRKAVVI
jgi:hypothetical protein